MSGDACIAAVNDVLRGIMFNAVEQLVETVRNVPCQKSKIVWR